MINLLIILLLSIYHSILFYDNNLGLSVILFIIPLLLFIVYYLKNKKLIKSKKGLLFMIPITLLATSYLIFNNEFFYYMNMIIITVLFLLMFIYTVKPTFNIKDILINMANLIIRPFEKFGDVIEDSVTTIKTKLRISEKSFKIIKSILIVIPIIVLVLILLMSADMVFDNLMSKILTYPKELFINFDLVDFISRLIIISVLFLYLASTMYFLSKDYLDTENKNPVKKPKDSTTIIILLITLDIIYVIFDVIQINSLILHSTGSINYANYARQGFFQLMFVSFINIIIILKTKKYESKKLINILSIIMILLTFIIIISSILRMNLYESMYGYTLLRLLVYITLFTEIILIIPLIIYIINNKFNLTKTTMIIVITIYTLINFVNLDNIIANRNIQRYYDKNDIDIEYLENYYTDNIDNLTKFYKEVKDEEIKNSLYTYFKEIDTSYNFREYNFSKANAKKQIEDLKYPHGTF